jgi:predicted alpha/beta-hydrolase family hydrolase
MNLIKVFIPIGKGEKVSGVVSIPDEFQPSKTVAVILAHGSGNDMNNPLIVAAADGLCQEGFLTLRFNFLYKEKGRKSPDSQKKLVSTWRCVFEYLNNHPEFSTLKIVAAGKSMGGRVAAQMAAASELPAQGLVFLGYPLHPPGKKDQLKDAHLYDIGVPMLFFAGTRDSLCDLTQLQDVLKRLKVSWHLEIIDGGDHSFNQVKSANISREQIYKHITEEIVHWLRDNFQV